mgnify:FL=1
MGRSAPAANDWRVGSMYTFMEAGCLAHVSTTTVKNWLFGYSSGDRTVAPLFHPRDETAVSFLQMIEIMVAARFRKSKLGRGVRFSTVRDAYTNARDSFGIEYPFAHLRLDAFGGHIVHFLQQGGPSASVQSIDAPAQWTLPELVSQAVDQLEYEQDLATRWFPVGKAVPIVVDPRLSTGLPTILGRGVTVLAIRKRFKAGLRIEFIAEDFEMEPSLVETALQYWEQIAA